MKSLIVKRSVIIDGHKTSMSLEDDFWQGVKKIAAGRRMTIAGLVHEIDGERQARKSIVSRPAVRAGVLPQPSSAGDVRAGP
jgi:predicted DNA-binding ribbon-helix-helix protein